MVKKAVKSPKVERELEVSFTVQGYVTQHITVTDPKMTEKKLQKLLDSGKAMTTIQEGGSVLVTKTMRKIGKVTFVENNCEYGEFEVEDKWK